VERTWDGLPVAGENPVAAAIVIWRRSGSGAREYLVLHRHHHGPDCAGEWAWTPPSGARQPGEAPEAAAARELREETGLDLPLAPLESATEAVALFVAEAAGDAELSLEPEHDRYAWVTLEEAVARCLPPVVAEGIHRAAAHLDAAAR
jgi:8-oxo-dGTP pyrophosphatase MutT (NUDIX family)